MSQIRGKNTKPELLVRRLCRDIGYSGYRIHVKTLPGTPDIAWIGRKRAVFVNGCFWHGHGCNKSRHKPESNQEYWSSKIEKNRYRNAKNIRDLRNMGWKVAIVWECELNDIHAILRKLKKLLKGS